MKPTINLLRELERKGLDPKIPYNAIVVDNNDPDRLFRIRARIPILQDAIKDDELPWLIPEDNIHPRGLMGGVLGHTACVWGTPVRGSWVSVSYKHDGDPHLGSYSTRVPFNSTTLAEEFEVNYPDRLGYVLPSGHYFVIDERTRETFVNFPGDHHVTVFGDLRQTVIGNHQLHVAKDVNAIPQYLKDNVSSILDSLGKQQKGRVPFAGFRKKDSGNMHVIVEGDFTQDIKGDHEMKIGGKQVIQVKGSVDYTTSSTYKINGTRIDLA
jgi:hypothetical protein